MMADARGAPAAADRHRRTARHRPCLRGARRREPVRHRRPAGQRRAATSARARRRRRGRWRSSRRRSTASRAGSASSTRCPRSARCASTATRSSSRCWPRTPGAGSPPRARDLARVEAIARAVMSRLLHEPTIRLRSLGERPRAREPRARARAVRPAGGRTVRRSRRRPSWRRSTTCPRAPPASADAHRHAGKRARARAGRATSPSCSAAARSCRSRTSGDRGGAGDPADKSRWVAELEDALAGGRDRPRGALGQGRPRRARRGPRAARRARAGGAPRTCSAARARWRSWRPGARVGTSSIRRAGAAAGRARGSRGGAGARQRGHAPAQARRAGAGLAAIVLARAGLQRLGRESEVGGVLDPGCFVPGAGSGHARARGARRGRRARRRGGRGASPIGRRSRCLLAERALARSWGRAATRRSARTPRRAARGACCCAPGSGLPGRLGLGRRRAGSASWRDPEALGARGGRAHERRGRGRAAAPRGGDGGRCRRLSAGPERSISWARARATRAC